MYNVYVFVYVYTYVCMAYPISIKASKNTNLFLTWARVDFNEVATSPLMQKNRKNVRIE